LTRSFSEDIENIGMVELHVIPNVRSEYTNNKFKLLDSLTGI